MIWTPAYQRIDLAVRVDRHEDASILYSADVNNWLTGVAKYAVFGGQPVEFDCPPAHYHLAEKDPKGETAKAIELAKALLCDNGHKEPPGGVRGIQFVIGGRQNQTRCNAGMRGILWGKIDPVEGHPEKLTVQLGFSLHDDEGEYASHVTVFGGTFEGNPSWLVFSDLIPSAIRKQRSREVARMVAKGLPRIARRRFWGLVRDANASGELDELRGLLVQAYLSRRDSMGDCKGVMLRGMATEILEELERSRRAGLPTRGSAVEVIPAENPYEELRTTAQPVAEDPESPARRLGALSSLTPRAREILRLRYEEDLTQEEVAHQLRLTQGRVCQIEKQALAELRSRVGPESD